MTQNIRNFVITAHIDHGKSTLADRLLEVTGTVEKRLMQAQYLDSMDLERERGITIKMAPVRMLYHPKSPISNTQFPNKNLEISNLELGIKNSEYILNLIDTPGHADFSYEVSRALAAVEGAVLLVDAQQGIQAQTLANYENAKRANLKIIGAVNKVDVADPEQIQDAILDLAELIGVGAEEILKVSGKTGEGVDKLLVEIVRQVPPPRESTMNVGRALVFDSLYDEHKGVVAFIRVFDGSFQGNQDIRLIATNTTAKAKEIGFFTPKLKPFGVLETGETGYIATGIKDPDKLKIGDTLVGGDAPPLIGYKEPKPVVFVSFYPEEGDKYDELKQALGKLRLTDSALTFEADSSEFLGRGFKGGFLGKLHFEITAERLEREFKISTVHSFPSVAYKVDGKLVTNPKDFPNDYGIAEEPMTRIEIVTPPQYLGAVLQLREVYRITNITTETLSTKGGSASGGKNKMLVRATLPLSDLIRDLDDRLKSVSHGFASFYYELSGYERSEVAKLEIAVAEQIVPGLTRILPKKDLEKEGRSTVEKLKELLPRQQFSQALQAISLGRIIARETIPAMKKDLGNFGKNGGDITRKMKLWKKQDRGKQRLKERGESSQIKISANVFKELLKK
ncbi:MAG: GTP-binding protein [bacterium]|nr:GTP-binding protein [bacterium]